MREERREEEEEDVRFDVLSSCQEWIAEINRKWGRTHNGVRDDP